MTAYQYPLKNALKKKRSKAIVASMAGMTLVELMIAILISLILLVGITAIFINSKQAYRIQEDMSVMQENSRVLLNLMSYDIRLADHWGGVKPEEIDADSTGITGIGSCNADWIVEDSTGIDGIMGYEGAATSPLPAGCIAAGDYVANTDIIVVRYADGDGKVSNAQLNIAPNDDHPFVKAVPGRRAEIDIGSGLYTDDIPVIGEYNYPYRIAVYFIRPCSVKAGLVCTSSDDNGSPIPTLTRLVLKGNTLTQEALIEGVEQLQFDYALLDDKGSTAQTRVDAGSGALDDSSEWATVGAVRVGIIVRANTRDIAFSDSDTYTLPGEDGGSFTYIPPSDAQTYHRKQFTKTINIRNRVRS